MSLQDVVTWAIHNQDKKRLRAFVRRDPRGKVNENDVSVCYKFLEEIIKRAKLSEDHMNKAIGYERTIAEYIEELEKRGVKYTDIKPEEPEPESNV